MGLRFDPMGGGTFKQAIKTIVEAESQPIKQLEARKATEEAKLKLFGEFKSKFANMDKAIAEVADFRKFREYKVDLGDGANMASVTIDKEKAQPGSYQIEVNSLASRSSVISNGFEKPDEPVLGLGFIVMNLGNGDSAEVFVDEAQSSLRGIAAKLNSEQECPVRAAVIQDASEPDAPWKLILTGKKDGKENAIEFPEFYFMDGSKDLYVDSDREASNAAVRVDGFPVEMPSNDINDFLPGVNLHLKQAREGQPFTLTITEDTQKMSGKIKGMVDQLNGILGFIAKQNQIDEKSDTRATFAGDTSLQGVEYRLRNLMHEGFPTGFNEDGSVKVVFLSELGVEFDKAGVINFKEEKFQKALEKNFDHVAEAISGQMGFAFQLKEVIGSYTKPGQGMLSTRETSMRGRIKQIDTQIENKTRALEKRQQALVDQFSRLQTSLSNLQRQQQAVSATLGGSGGGTLQQLLGG